ncbi:MAG: DUF58 domain-containing protein [Actinomycetota bacterium]
MSRRPTGRGIVVTTVGAMILLAAASAQAGWLFVIAVGVLGAVLGSAFVPHRLSSLWIERQIPSRAVAGDAIEVALTATNRGSKPTPPVRIEDLSSAFPVMCESLAPGTSATSSAPRHAPRRGIFDGGQVRIACGAPFGFIASVRTVTVESPITVVPPTVELDSLSWITGGGDASEGGHAVRSSSGEYLGVRDYRPGDPRRAVHWRSSARAGTLIVREFEDVAAPRPTLLIHGADAGTPPDSPYEAIVTAAASIARHLVRSGHDVHLVRTGPAGVQHLVDAPAPEILEWLAGCKPEQSPLSHAVAGALARSERDAVVVVLTTTSGTTPADLAGALDHIASAGGRPALVIARSATWVQTANTAERDVVAAARGRGPLRILAKGEDMAACLAG